MIIERVKVRSGPVCDEEWPDYSEIPGPRLDPYTHAAHFSILRYILGWKIILFTLPSALILFLTRRFCRYVTFVAFLFLFNFAALYCVFP
jgi:hypothetical protein